MILDAHVHCYDPARPVGIPHPSPTNPLLYRTMLPAQLRAAAEPSGVGGAILVECSPWVEDNQWCLNLARDEPFLRAVVGHLDPADDSFPALLRRFAADPLFRGIRARPLRWEAPALHRHLGFLAEHDLTLDLLVKPADLPRVRALARALPHLRLMVDHLASPPAEPAALAAWQEGLSSLADAPNVSCKLSAFMETATVRPAPPGAETYAPLFDAAVRTFGPERLAFGSNWPPCLQAGTYADTVRIAWAHFAGDARVREQVFFRTAARFYGGPRLSGA